MLTYICANFSKSEDEISEAMKEGAKEPSILRRLDFEKMKAIAKTYTLKEDCLVEEAVPICPWLHDGGRIKYTWEKIIKISLNRMGDVLGSFSYNN